MNPREIVLRRLAGCFAAVLPARIGHSSGRAVGCCAILVVALGTHGIPAGEPAAGTATGEQPAAESGSTATPTVTVEGRREREQIEREVHAFISSVAVNNWDEPLARWQAAVCPLVAGLPKDRGVAVFKRVAEIVADAGLPLGARDCPANLLIIATRNPEASLRELWAANPKLLTDDRGRAGIDRFIHGTQPIRAWHNECSEAPSSAKGLRTGVRCNSSSVGSLLVFEAIRSIYSAVVVVDLERTGELDDRQLAGYAAMVALVQTRDNRVPSVPTILQLFSAPETPKPQDLSSWDRAFLKALYSVNPGDVGQVAEIANAMQRQLLP